MFIFFSSTYNTVHELCLLLVAYAAAGEKDCDEFDMGRRCDEKQNELRC